MNLLESFLMDKFNMTEAQAIAAVDEAYEEFDYLVNSEEEVTDAVDFLNEYFGSGAGSFADYFG